MSVTWSKIEIGDQEWIVWKDTFGEAKTLVVNARPSHAPGASIHAIWVHLLLNQYELRTRYSITASRLKFLAFTFCILL